MPLFAPDFEAFHHTRSLLLSPFSHLPQTLSSSRPILSASEATPRVENAPMPACSSMLSDLPMADVHLFSPLNPAHDPCYIFNSVQAFPCDAVEHGAWQHFLQNPLPLPSLNPVGVSEMGFHSTGETIEGAILSELVGRLGGEFSHGNTSLASDSINYPPKIGEGYGWRSLNDFNNSSFGVDVPKLGDSLPAASLPAMTSADLVGMPADAGYAQYTGMCSSFCHCTSSQLGQQCGGASKKSEFMESEKKPLRTFSGHAAVASGRGMAAQPTPQKEEECPEHSYSSGHDAGQNISPTVKGRLPGKKRKTAETRTSVSSISNGCGEMRAVKKPRTEDAKKKGHASSEIVEEAEDTKKKAENSSGNSESSIQTQAKESVKPPEAPKQDFIHVRARRGQATDSHSLAERVRREKISERMKFLQDLVPGCNKVSGKAVMLDEIINYVQSLQHQVEFLSMKLAAVNPSLNFNLESIYKKEALREHMNRSPFGFDHEPFPSFSMLASARAQMSQLGVRSTGGLDSRSMNSTLESSLKESNATMLNTSMLREMSSQTTFWDEHVQNPLQTGF